MPIDLALFVSATILGAFVAGLAGFTFGVVAAIWPHILTPLLGIPLGIESLRWLPASTMRGAVGAVLAAFSLHNLQLPRHCTDKASSRTHERATNEKLGNNLAPGSAERLAGAPSGALPAMS